MRRFGRGAIRDYQRKGPSEDDVNRAADWLAGLSRPSDEHFQMHVIEALMHFASGSDDTWGRELNGHPPEYILAWFIYSFGGSYEQMGWTVLNNVLAYHGVKDRRRF